MMARLALMLIHMPSPAKVVNARPARRRPEALSAITILITGPAGHSNCLTPRRMINMR